MADFFNIIIFNVKYKKSTIRKVKPTLHMQQQDSDCRQEAVTIAKKSLLLFP